VIRLVLVALLGVPATVYYAVRIVWGVHRNAADPSCVCDDLPRRWAAFMLRAAGVSVALEDEHRIDRSVPQVLVANHVSWFDVLALAAFLPGPYVFVAKKEIEGVPFFGRAVRACGHIFIDRKDHAAALASLGAARERLERRRPTIIMFPEGTRSASGLLQPFKKGAFVLAIQARADVIPAAISGSREIMRKGSLLIRSGTVRVRFGEPIDVGAFRMEERDELTRRAWEALAALQVSSPT
jgi:1-acyl-sn-glycerol-3-phosphate acyltransferase